MKKSFPHAVAAVCLWLGFVCNSFSQPGTSQLKPEDESTGLPKQIRVQVEFIDVSHEQFTELMFGPKPPANDGELRKQVAQLVKDGKATIMETLLCTTRSGLKATSESIEEIIYPSEYEPAELPNNIHVKDEEAAEKLKEKVRDLATGPMPTAFDTRNVGSTLEIEPTLDSYNKTIDLRFVPEIVYHVGNEVWAEWKGEHGNSPIQMPTFYAIRINTNVTLIDGHFMLAAALSPKDNKGVPDFTRKLMIFVRADVIMTGK